MVRRFVLKRHVKIQRPYKKLTLYIMKTLLGIVIVVILGVLIWRLADGTATAPTTNVNINATSTSSTNSGQVATSTGSTTSTPVTRTVTYNGTTFSPSSITIKQGDSITFINTSANEMRVASNDHPEHTIYPEFDQGETTADGMKTFTFTFNKIGTWGYHDHENDSVGGTVIVTAR
jgi:plastocyanin